MTSSASAQVDDNEQNTIDIHNLPKYCDYSKFLLVEELALETDYRELHYGKCSLIGKLKQDGKGYNYLENVQINDMPSECRLPESCLKILLHMCNKKDFQLKSSHYYEIVGEVILFNNITPEENNANFLTSRGIVEQRNL